MAPLSGKEGSLFFVPTRLLDRQTLYLLSKLSKTSLDPPGRKQVPGSAELTQLETERISREIGRIARDIGFLPLDTGTFLEKLVQFQVKRVQFQVKCVQYLVRSF